MLDDEGIAFFKAQAKDKLPAAPLFTEDGRRPCEKDVWEYIRTKDLPYNRLHDRSYPSMGANHALVHSCGAFRGSTSRRAVVVGAIGVARVRTARSVAANSDSRRILKNQARTSPYKARGLLRGDLSGHWARHWGSFNRPVTDCRLTLHRRLPA